MIKLVHLCAVGVLSGSLLAGASVQAQKKGFESYTQEIAGMNASFEMVAIQEGKFLMGSPATETGSEEDEQPQHEVKISPFWMGKFEVTWDLFEPFVYKDFEVGQHGEAIPAEVDAVARPTKPYLDMTFGMGKNGHPAVGMTQYAAVQFCKWLYMRTGVFYRLPTEAEWEYAARAGSKQAYFFGDKPDKLKEYAWFEENSDGRTHPVGGKKPNPWGLYDMYGNVSEWTMDQYIPDYYVQLKGSTAVDPVAIPENLYPHTLRGGSFADGPASLRSANREASNPDWKRIDPQIPKSNWWFPEAPFLGLRVVRPLETPSTEEIEAYYNEPAISDYGY